MGHIFSTDTASMCIFDYAQLKHRLNDRSDWWASRFQEIEEINKGNAIIVGLLVDGSYEFDLSLQQHFLEPYSSLTANLHCSSGKVFIGAGEDISGDDFEPDDEDGVVISIPPGCYSVQVCRLESNRLGVAFKPSDECNNQFDKQLSLGG